MKRLRFLRKLKLFNKKYSALILLFIIIFSVSIKSNLILAISYFLFLFVPCGIKPINKKWYLWIPRELIFLLISLFFLEVYIHTGK